MIDMVPVCVVLAAAHVVSSVREVLEDEDFVRANFMQMSLRQVKPVYVTYF